MLHLVDNFHNSIVELAQNLACVRARVTSTDAAELAQRACRSKTVGALDISRALQCKQEHGNPLCPQN